MTTRAIQCTTYKMVVLGYYSVGKSSLVLKYAKDEFNENEESTIGASFMTKTMSTRDLCVKFEIWDTAGQERYNSLIPMYYRGAQIGIIVYDITSKESFEVAKRWVEELKFEKSSDFLKVLVANKLDLENERQVTFEEGKEYAMKENILFLEASAKEGTNVNLIFEMIVSKIPRETPKTKKKGLKLGDSLMKYFCC
ncbi:Ras-related protein Rab-5 [Vairimorpha necatrix]|uniref:Ras-related protein Rab-5 n=1 Tax=Vairimorpha necatrix TaxID=6039 RepID=A0AAX4JDI2_9MICR